MYHQQQPAQQQQPARQPVYYDMQQDQNQAYQNPGAPQQQSYGGTSTIFRGIMRNEKLFSTEYPQTLFYG